MAVFMYRCTSDGHLFEQHHTLGKAPPKATCGHHGVRGVRHFGPESMPQIVAQDPFRKYDLSPRKEQAQVAQQRVVDAPRDRFEAKRMERELGRVYVGDDTSGMSARARRGIDTAKEKVK